jgi:hypothetical protein
MLWMRIHRIRKLLGHPDLDLLQDPSINKQKNFKKSWFLLLVFCYFLWLFIYEYWCDVPSKSNKQKALKNNLFVLMASCQPLTEKQDPDPEPDPWISGTNLRIRTKMSRIHNSYFTVPGE